MKPEQDNYPVFEANQILSYLHLNQVFNYLEEQERLTRANLIGIGIVCGLEIRFDPGEAPAAIHLTRGCGVTSQGYLIVEPENVSLLSYREYTLPDDPDYLPFRDATLGVQFPLWELFPAGEPDTTELGTPPDFLRDKVVVLFLELKKEGLRNCSPNNCDDRGAAVTAVVRRLLISRSDMDKIIAAANNAGLELSLTALTDTLGAELGLPDLRLPRYDVPNTSPATSEQVLAAFYSIFQANKLSQKTAAALSAAYQAFKPVLLDLYPDDPFANTFSAKFGFLDTAPKTPEQVRFLQYYYDFFDDLLKAYDELRDRGVGLMCACCPPEGLFPRHLMLGLLFQDAQTGPGSYRHHFIASPALSRCGEYTNELRQLFQRLVQMMVAFTIAPVSPDPATGSTRETQIRITPSKLWDAPLSEKAIPYYYVPEGVPAGAAPLHHLWSPEKTRRNRANQNLGYHSDTYAPPAPAFVANPLNYDLEPYNFLRIEGHLGRNYQSVLQTLLIQKARYRLPIEIVALRSGAFDEKMPVDLSKESCRFQDLETLYDALRAELSCFLCKEVQYFYNLPFDVVSDVQQSVKAKLPMLVRCAPQFMVLPRTLGRLFEDRLSALPGSLIADLNINFNLAFVGQSNVFLLLLTNVSRLYETLVPDLGQLNFAEFGKRYQALVKLTEIIERDREQSAGNIEGSANLLKWEELDDRLEAIVYNCRLDAFKALQAEYLRRIREAKQKQFLAYFLRNHPGIQHKAGVPLGGTFILVYHDDPDRIRPRPDFFADSLVASVNLDVNLDGSGFDGSGFDRCRVATTKTLTGALNRLQSKAVLLADPDIQLIFGELTGQIPTPPFFPGGLDEIFPKTVQGLADGAVIADFFLPYICCSDCAPIQFVLPAPQLGLAVKLGCTNADGAAEAALTPTGGTAPYSYQLDAQPFTELKGNVVLSAGPHTLLLRDSAGAESSLQSLTVPGPLSIGTEIYLDDASTQTYQVMFTISGGTAPYQAQPGSVTGNTFTSVPAPGGERINVTVIDSAGCTLTRDFTHAVCNLPCDGLSRRCAYRLWLQPAIEGAAYRAYKQESAIKFRFNGEDFDMSGTEDLLQAPQAQLNNNFANSIVGAVKKLNAAINEALVKKFGPEGKDRLVAAYEPAETDPFGILWIEHFVCETFAIEFDYTFAKPSPAFSLTIRYSNEIAAGGAPFDGAVFTNRRLDNKQTRVPAFDCSERDKCSGGDAEKLCEGADANPAIAIEPLDANRFSFKGEGDPAAGIVAWVWDCPVAQPTEPFYEGQAVEAQLEKPGGPAVLTVITEKGCFNSVQRNILQ